MDADEALIRAFNLGMDDAGWTEEVMDEADSLLPTLVAAGYAARDEEADTWWFTKEGVARHNEIELDGLQAALSERFHDPAPEFEAPSTGSDEAFVARFRNPTGSLGDALVWFDEARDLIVEIEGWTHHHETGTETEVINGCVWFLELLFSDRVVVWGTAESGGGSMTFAEGLNADGFDEEFGDSAASRVSTWSGRFRRINWG